MFGRSIVVLACTLVLGPVLSVGPAQGAAVITADVHLDSPDDSGQPNFGSSVAIDGDTAVIGTPKDSGSNAFVGAYVYTRDASGWSTGTPLTITLPAGSDPPLIGASVAIDGDTIAIGAPSEDVPDPTDPGGVPLLNRAGAVYVFVRDGSNWSQQARLSASNMDASDFFGGRVAIDGNTIVVGAVGEDASSTGVNGSQSSEAAADAGAVYVFDRSGSTWSQTAFIKASNTGAGDLFGTSVSLDAGTLVVGARGEDSAATGVAGNQSDETADQSGAAYVFTRINGEWSQDSYLKPSNTRVNFAFGVSVAVSGDTVAVGAPGEDGTATGVGGNQTLSGLADAGAAYVFTRSNATWSSPSYIKASNTDADDEFGGAVTLEGDRLVIGAANESSAASGINGNEADDTLPRAGAAYVFERSNATWAQDAYVKSPDPDEFAAFGQAVATSGTRLVIGAPADDVGELQNLGGADIYQWVDDGTSPVTGSVLLTVAEGGRISDIPAAIRWTATDDTSSEWQLRHTVEIRRRKSSGWGAWQRLATDVAATERHTAIAAGKKYQARVRTTDEAGNIGSWVTSSTILAVTRQETKFSLTGSWKTASDSQAMGDQVAKSKINGSNARLAFYGRGVGAVMPVGGETLGDARICVDRGMSSEACEIVQLGGTTFMTRRVVIVFDGLALGNHTLDVTARNGLTILDGAVVWK